LGLADGELGIGIVARLDPIKAIDVLLEAFARVALARPRARLIVIGGGPEAGRLHALARSLGIDSRVRFTGAVPDAARLLGGLDLYVSASRREGLSLAVLEAMALGLPVVATRVAGHLDAVSAGITGFVGSHMAEYALSKGAEVFGSNRWRSKTENIDHLRSKVSFIESDLRDLSSVRALLETSQPDYVVHLAAQSFVGVSWHAPAETLTTNILAQINVLEAIRGLKMSPR